MECQLENLEHSWHILLFEFKSAEAARNICAMYEDNAIRESTARKWFSRFEEDHFHISDTPHSGRPSGFDEDRLNTLIHVSVLENRQMGWTVTISNHETFAFNGQGSKIGCMGTACSKPKPQKLASGHMCISACSSSIGSFQSCIVYWWREMVSLF